MLKEDGSVWAWERIVHQVWHFSHIEAIFAGKYHSLVLDHNDIAWSSGSNSFGQLENGTINNGHSTDCVVGLENVVANCCGGII
ncbi:MAG: hypothetical protein M0Q40_11470 [Limnochordia bacterium]|nr:hypothetical protein [Limnochordia bacterium]